MEKFSNKSNERINKMKNEKFSLCSEMVKICQNMESSGINQGTAGNLSSRYGEGFLITPTSMPYNEMKPEDVVEMGWDGTYLGKRPSSEWRFHRDILKNRSDINVVLHSHSLNATSLAIHHKTIPAFHYMVGLAGGNNIRCAKYETFGTQALSDAALIALEDRMACLLGQHGMICLGKTFDEAFTLATELETLSKIYVKALSIGETPVLSDEEMVKVIDQMKRMSYGKGPEPEGSNDIARPRNE
jgi:L-fuculose-phosphate aldolase